MSTTIDTMQKFLQDVLGPGYVVDWPPNMNLADSTHVDFDIIEASTYFYICMIRVEDDKIIIIDHKYKTGEFEFSDPRYDPNELLIKIKAIRNRALNAFKKARQQEIIIGISNITELITKESVDLNGQIVRLHGDARCDSGAYEDLATEALRIADEIINPPEDK